VGCGVFADTKHPPFADGTFFSKEVQKKANPYPALFRKEGGSAEPGVLTAAR